jgi:hypothetical protein
MQVKCDLRLAGLARGESLRKEVSSCEIVAV